MNYGRVVNVEKDSALRSIYEVCIEVSPKYSDLATFLTRVTIYGL